MGPTTRVRSVPKSMPQAHDDDNCDGDDGDDGGDDVDYDDV